MNEVTTEHMFIYLIVTCIAVLGRFYEKIYVRTDHVDTKTVKYRLYHFTLLLNKWISLDQTYVMKWKRKVDGHFHLWRHIRNLHILSLLRVESFRDRLYQRR